MDYTIRRARPEDCARMMELIRELAVFERAPDEVTVSLQHFEESGFGERPVWWAFVACAPKQAAAAEAAQPEQQSIGEAAPLQLIHTAEEATATASVKTPDQLQEPPVIRLDEPVQPELPDSVREALPLMAPAASCEEVIGFALYYVRYSTWKGQRMYLEDILVTESWRGKGVGTALMDALIAAARAEGFQGISWQVLDWNEPAIRFFERYQARFDPSWVNVAIDL